ncbi:hypothetical protein EXE44_05210 [Halorubrum sp. SS7]|uniref:hypothetical protein n=1 Tax=unclassified Halorubrum TaxID=2642239 RepID=UPI0010F8E78F|nr:MULTISPECIES: hypothetical protein [unclassified Halorubrum]TKX58946.1 hypothetical protein EXE44_05210 [Halorubrum sp. SS7]TKX59205.1 hypothetical protein EXE45_17565 [Halorubrum sp. SP9]
MPDDFNEEDIDAVLERIEREQEAFKMYLAGYRQRVRDEQRQPSSLRQREGFANHLKNKFRGEYDE